MKKIITLALTVISLCTECSAQYFPGKNVYDNFFQWEQVPLQSILEIENKLKSNQKSVESPIFIAEDFLPQKHNISPHPLIFIREDKDFKPVPEVEVMYHYSEQDAIVRLVTYTWNSKKAGMTLKDINVDHSDKLLDYNRKFDALYNHLNNVIGSPKQDNSSMERMRKKDYGEWLERSALWQKNNSVTELKMIFTPNGGGMGTYRIRIKIFWEE